MGVTALVTWVLTALGGLVMLAIWVGGVVRQPPGPRRGSPAGGTRLPRPALSGHVLLAPTGLILWIIYLVTDSDALAWVTVALLVVVVALGLTMFAGWSRGRTRSAHSRPAPEDSFPVAVVFGHGLLAVTTFVLVLLTALEIGGS